MPDTELGIVELITNGTITGKVLEVGEAESFVFIKGSLFNSTIYSDSTFQIKEVPPSTVVLTYFEKVSFNCIKPPCPSGGFLYDTSVVVKAGETSAIIFK